MSDHLLGDGDQPQRARLGRRRVVASAGLLGVSMAVSGCGGTDKPAAGVSRPSAGASTSAPLTGGTDLARTAEIPVGGGAVFPVNRVVVTQPSSGQFRAFSAICSHEGCTVNQVADGTVNCPCHGSRFSISDGSVVRGPATHPLHPRSITVRDGSVVLNQ
jgi:Rieske Fe-S protein